MSRNVLTNLDQWHLQLPVFHHGGPCVVLWHSLLFPLAAIASFFVLYLSTFMQIIHDIYMCLYLNSLSNVFIYAIAIKCKFFWNCKVYSHYFTIFKFSKQGCVFSFFDVHLFLFLSSTWSYICSYPFCSVPGCNLFGRFWQFQGY